eukprot:3758964-Rhodomonas_salina.1
MGERERDDAEVRESQHKASHRPPEHQGPAHAVDQVRCSPSCMGSAEALWPQVHLPPQPSSEP